jgi:hypothetical protein
MDIILVTTILQSQSYRIQQLLKLYGMQIIFYLVFEECTDRLV